MSDSTTIQPGNPPTSNFEIDPSLASWGVTAKEWLEQHDKHWDRLVTGCIVFNPLGKLLLIQRASHDTMPNKWEIPGGAVDDEDPSLLSAAARELWEEAGLVARRFTNVVSESPDQEPGQLLIFSKAVIWCRFSFIVEVEDCESVRLDADEHQDYLWATEEEVRSQKVGDREVPITTGGMSQVILAAFVLRAQRLEAPVTSVNVKSVS